MTDHSQQPPGTRRRFLRHWAALSLTAGGLSGVIQQALANGTHPVAPGVHTVKGQVLVNGKPAQAGTAIQPGDTISTGPGSEAIYVVGQNAYLQRADSKVEISAAQQAGALVNSGLRLLAGKLLSVFRKGTPQRLETATATIGIRGTGCYMEVEAERMYICLCYGEAEYTPTVAPDKAQVLRTDHHEHPVWISATDKATPITAAPMLNHTDAELTLLENLVGRWPPFYGKVDYHY